ncbi:OsmC family protein [Ruminococcaceae bacterium OttesenSCG-928-I18]|nr:OsmC family protein [Ruminococcaceae bacterium OttesenSCG-928-I18]
MTLTTKASVKKLADGKQVEADFHGLKMIFDESKQDGGTGLGPSPMKVLLASMGACQTMTAHSIAKKMRIELTHFSVELEGDLDSEALEQKEGAPRGFTQVRYHFHVQTEAPREKVERLIRLVEEYCPVENTLRNEVKLVRSGLSIEK